jgi:hypothetical protein
MPIVLQHILTALAPTAIIVALLKYGPNWIDAWARFRVTSKQLHSLERTPDEKNALKKGAVVKGRE